MTGADIAEIYRPVNSVILSIYLFPQLKKNRKFPLFLIFISHKCHIVIHCMHGYYEKNSFLSSRPRSRD